MRLQIRVQRYGQSIGAHAVSGIDFGKYEENEHLDQTCEELVTKSLKFHYFFGFESLC